MKQLIIISLEPLPTRYTIEWFTYLPKMFKDKLGEGYEIIQLDGETKSSAVTKGAFLDFESTMTWKSEQIIKFFQLMKLDRIKDDAIILFTDAWNPCVNQIKYTKELCKKEWKLVGIWHAGSYDEHDFLGRIDHLKWSFATEESLYHAYDYNCFATKFHKELFHKTIANKDRYKSYLTGLPMDYIRDIKFPNLTKEDIIVFPGRIAPEKQPEIVKAIENKLPGYQFVYCCEQNLTKKQYHEILAKSKIMISTSLQETLGITQCEAMAAKCIPLIPNRLSYTEMYSDKSFLYPSEWSQSLDNYDLDSLVHLVENMIINYDSYIMAIEENFEYQMKNFFGSDKLVNLLKIF